MKKYMIYFKNGLQTVIYGYSEQDAMIRARVNKNQIQTIFQHYLWSTLNDSLAYPSLWL